MTATITRIKYTFCIALLVFNGFLLAQEKKSLGPGSELTTVKFPVKNYSKDSIDLSNYKDQLIIIDIWDVTCSACITAMPKMEKLQEKYKDQIKIILLSNDNLASIEKLKLRSEILQKVKLPMIIGDSNLESLIKYTYLPTYVWIKDGKTILNITDSKDFSEDKIKEFLSSGNLNAKNKKEIDTRGKDPLLIKVFPFVGREFDFYSFLWKETYSVYSGETIIRVASDTANNLIESIRITGANIKSLYKAANDDTFRNLSFRRIIFDNLDADLADTSIYTFEMIFGKPQLSGEVLELARKQLDLNFNMTSKIETRLQDVYVLKRINNFPLKKLTSTKNNITRGIGTSDSGIILAFKDAIWAYVQAALAQGQIVPPYEVIDETGIDIGTKVNFEMPQDLTLENLGNVNNELKKVGLAIEFTKRPLEVVVIYGK